MTEIFPRQLGPFAVPVHKHQCKLENQLRNKENKKKIKIIRRRTSRCNLEMPALALKHLLVMASEFNDEENSPLSRC